MSPPDSPIDGLDLDAYDRRGNAVHFIFHWGNRSAEAHVEILEGRNQMGELWFEARSEFKPLHPAGGLHETVVGYGWTEAEAILASVKLYQEHLRIGFTGGRAPP